MGVVSSTWITAKWYSLRHTFPLAPHASFNASFLRLGDIAPSWLPAILTASFRRSLAPVSSLQTVIHPLAIRSVIFRFRSVLVRSGLIILFECRWPGSRSLYLCSPPADPCAFEVQRYRTQQPICMFCYFLSRIVYHQSVNHFGSGNVSLAPRLCP